MVRSNKEIPFGVIRAVSKSRESQGKKGYPHRIWPPSINLSMASVKYIFT